MSAKTNNGKSTKCILEVVSIVLGLAQIIIRDNETGVLNGACDKCCDSNPMAF